MARFSPDDIKMTVAGHGGALHRIASTAETRITTNQGAPVSNDQSSPKAAVCGPTLLGASVIYEKIQHFDHAFVPEPMVHARGLPTHGFA